MTVPKSPPEGLSTFQRATNQTTVLMDFAGRCRSHTEYVRWCRDFRKEAMSIGSTRRIIQAEMLMDIANLLKRMEYRTRLLDGMRVPEPTPDAGDARGN